MHGAGLLAHCRHRWPMAELGTIDWDWTDWRRSAMHPGATRCAQVRSTRVLHVLVSGRCMGRAAKAPNGRHINSPATEGQLLLFNQMDRAGAGFDAPYPDGKDILRAKTPEARGSDASIRSSASDGWMDPETYRQPGQSVHDSRIRCTE